MKVLFKFTVIISDPRVGSKIGIAWKVPSGHTGTSSGIAERREDRGGNM